MNVRGMMVLAFIGMLFLSGVVALVYLRHVGFVTEAGELLRRWDALWAGWPIYLFFGLTWSLVFVFIQSYILEGVYRIDTERARNELEAAAKRGESDLAFERKKFKQEKAELWNAKMQVESEKKGAEEVLKFAREISDRANEIEAESERAVAEIKEKMRHKEGYQRRYKTKLAKLNE